MASSPIDNTSSSSIITKAVMDSVFRTDKLNICHINVQSVCARGFSKFDELKAVFFNSKAHIVCMSETWLNESINDSMIRIEGYNLIRNDRNRHGGGLCVYFRQNLSLKLLKKSTFSPYEPSHITEYLLFEVATSNRKFFLGVYYNPPNNDCSNLIFEHLEEFKMKYD